MTTHPHFVAMEAEHHERLGGNARLGEVRFPNSLAVLPGDADLQVAVLREAMKEATRAD